MILYLDKEKVSFCELSESGTLEAIIDGVPMVWIVGNPDTESAINTFKHILEA